MKSIYDVRRENLRALIDSDFNGTQARLAEKMEMRPNLINRWVNGKKVIGAQSARKIEVAARKPAYWMDLDKSYSAIENDEEIDSSDIGKIAAHNLDKWMKRSNGLNSQGKLSRASGVAQATINRMVNNEVSVSITTLESIAAAFGRHGYELLILNDDPAIIRYDRCEYAALPDSEKSKIESFIEFIILQNNKNQNSNNKT